MVKDNENTSSVLTFKKLSADKIMRLEAVAREKAYRDRLSFLQACVDSYAKGYAKGRAEVRALVTENLRAMGMSEEQIKTALGIQDQ